MTAKKKDLHQASSASADIMNTIVTGEPVKDPKPAKKSGEKNYYRLSLKMPKEYEGYLKAAAYKASKPTHIVSMTEYICNLIKKDMEEHK